MSPGSCRLVRPSSRPAAGPATTSVPWPPFSRRLRTSGVTYLTRCWPRRKAGNTVTRPQLLAALKRSSRGVEALLAFGVAAGGHVPPSKRYVWRNLPLDVPHILTYLVAHEGHHRGQIVMLARQLGHRLPSDVTAGLWHWTRRRQEAH